MPNSKKSKPAPKASAPKPSKPAPEKQASAHGKPASNGKPAAPAHNGHAKPQPAATNHGHDKHPQAPAKHAAAKPVPAKPAPAKPAPEKALPAKPAPAKPAPAKVESVKTEARPAAAKPDARPDAKPVGKPEAKPAGKAEAKPAGKPDAKPAGKAESKAEALRAHILERRSAKPIAFTLDEVREIAKVNVPRDERSGGDAKGANGKSKGNPDEIEAKIKKAAQPHHVKPASLADILGYTPGRQAAPGTLDPDKVDPKFQKFFRLLIELREHVMSGLSTHAEETLKRSAKEDSGDLSGYAQHMADAGTDTFDRDFALSLVSNEQEALAEIDAAIQRVHAGTYGVCELTGKPITRERLSAVPFARYSVESQAEVERTKRRSAHRGGLFGEGEEGGKIEEESSEE